MIRTIELAVAMMREKNGNTFIALDACNVGFKIFQAKLVTGPSGVEIHRLILKDFEFSFCVGIGSYYSCGVPML